MSAILGLVERRRILRLVGVDDEGPHLQHHVVAVLEDERRLGLRLVVLPPAQVDDRVRQAADANRQRLAVEADGRVSCPPPGQSVGCVGLDRSVAITVLATAKCESPPYIKTWRKRRENLRLEMSFIFFSPFKAEPDPAHR